MKKQLIIFTTVFLLVCFLFVSCGDSNVGQQGSTLGLVDIDGDGTADGDAIDIDGDGLPDGVDSNGDGIIDDSWSDDYSIISPEISLIIGENLASGSSYSFGSSKMLSRHEVNGTIKNDGTAALLISKIEISGTDSDQFELITTPDSTIAAGKSSSFRLVFEGSSAGNKSAVLTVSNNDSDESSFTVKLSGSATDRSWTEVTSAADWPARYSHAAVVFKDKMWVLGGIDFTGGIGSMDDVWCSNDGKNWTSTVAHASWCERKWPTALVYDDKIWVLGGYGDGDGDGNSEQLNDVWYSSDGTTWTEATSSAAWSARRGQGVVVYDGKMWVLGGYDDNDLNDVWYSTDGKNWTLATANAQWNKRADMAVLAFKGKMWIVGGYYGNNDVWSSTDGVNWTKSEKSGDSWDLYESGAAVYDDKMWLMGGRTGFTTKNDFLCSSDGAVWKKIECSTIWGIRSKLEALVFNDKIWALGGKTPGESGQADIVNNEVWCW